MTGSVLRPKNLRWTEPSLLEKDSQIRKAFSKNTAFIANILKIIKFIEAALNIGEKADRARPVSQRVPSAFCSSTSQTHTTCLSFPLPSINCKKHRQPFLESLEVAILGDSSSLLPSCWGCLCLIGVGILISLHLLGTWLKRGQKGRKVWKTACSKNCMENVCKNYYYKKYLYSTFHVSIRF